MCVWVPSGMRLPGTSLSAIPRGAARFLALGPVSARPVLYTAKAGTLRLPAGRHDTPLSTCSSRHLVLRAWRGSRSTKYLLVSPGHARTHACTRVAGCRHHQGRQPRARKRALPPVSGRAAPALVQTRLWPGAGLASRGTASRVRRSQYLAVQGATCPCPSVPVARYPLPASRCQAPFPPAVRRY